MAPLPAHFSQQLERSKRNKVREVTVPTLPQPHRQRPLSPPPPPLPPPPPHIPSLEHEPASDARLRSRIVSVNCATVSRASSWAAARSKERLRNFEEEMGSKGGWCKVHVSSGRGQKWGRLNLTRQHTGKICAAISKRQTSRFRSCKPRRWPGVRQFHSSCCRRCPADDTHNTSRFGLVIHRSSNAPPADTHSTTNLVGFDGHGERGNAPRRVALHAPQGLLRLPMGCGYGARACVVCL